MVHADKVFTGGVILTMNPRQPVVEALAVKDGRVLAAGRDAEIDVLTGPGTQRVDLHGRFAMPGLIESHTHALWGACRDLFQVYVGYTATVDKLADAIRQRARSLSRGDWITGGPWRLKMRAELGMTPRAWLDQIAPEHPVAVADTSQHAFWCNSAALAQAGINRDTPHIPGGVIERDSAGEPTGMLAEAAGAPVRRCTTWTQSQLSQASEYFIKYFNSLGYTGFKEPMADEEALTAYAAASDKGHLSLNMAAHITAFSPLTGTLAPIREIDRLSAKYERPGIRLGYAKLFLDGVAPAYTASFLDPYLPAPGYDPDSHDPDATLLMDPSTLNETVTALDAAGYVVKMHAVGDNAARKGLDAIEAARYANGSSGLRHEIAHSTFISDADLFRFAELGAVAEVSPKLWAPNSATASQRAVLGEERLTRIHRIRSLIEAGAEVIVGTDWPASAPDANPWTGLAGMLDRKDPTGQYPGTIAPDQAIPLDTALRLFTVNGARAMGMAGEAGQLVAGAWADMVVLSDDLRNMTPPEIGAIEVRQTIWHGQCVHEH
ncbi:amidohydrolase [Aquicoccus porphyridii]|uniref:amidohydrolase n=1 Tax=Aquicoccus porphyridii TaxID=1852029 RepID=UPI00273D8C93|nr:amidohydrolase [Aquicoccus porphyridii]